MIIIFWICGIWIVFGLVGYPISLLILDKFIKSKQVNKKYKGEPKVSLIIVAHNEEKVIDEKLKNVIQVDYPAEKLEIIVSSDNSTDKTNAIVKEFIEEHSESDIVLYQVKERKGKTNAQNEAVKIATGEIIVMTDANSMLDKKAIRELVSSFGDEDIAYVTGMLCYVNADQEWVSASENKYWNYDIRMREIEGRIQTITAGNGAIYACRRSEYVDFNPIECHDSMMPLYYALEGKRAICNHQAIAYEKAGEKVEDEYGRKVRMSRKILSRIVPSIKVFNIFKYKWFSYFYFGHRTSRYLLSLLHIILFIVNILIVKRSIFYQLMLMGQSLFYLLAIARWKLDVRNKYVNYIYYYCMTLVAQAHGILNQLTGKSKPFWEKAESTR